MGKHLALTAQQEQDLINAVKERPQLYDAYNKLYNVHPMRKAAWTEIGIKVGISADLCQKKWKNMRDTYFRKNRPCKNLDLRMSLAFLDTVVPPYRRAPKHGTEDLSGMEVECTNSQPGMSLKTEDDESFSLDDDNDPDEGEAEQVEEEYVPLRASGSHTLDQTECSATQSSEPGDDLDAFFKFITMTVRKLPPQMILEAKIQIFTLVSDLEIKTLKS